MAGVELAGMDKVKSSVTIKKVAAIIKSKHSSEMVDRHVKALLKVAHNNISGFLLRELEDLCQLFSVCSERLHRTPEYIDPLCQLVGIASLPFLKEKMSDETTFAPCVIEILSWLGRLARGKSDQLRAVVGKAVAAFYSEQPDLAQKQGLQMTKLTFNAALVERSGVAASLIEALRLCEGYQVRVDILRTLQLLSATTTNCNHMLSAEGARVVCGTLALQDSNQQSLVTSVEVLWNLLEHGSQLQVVAQLNSVECISILRGVFCELMVEGHKGLEIRQLRNDVLMICSRVAQFCPEAPFVETGFLKELCFFASFSEETTAQASSLPRLTQQHEDFELKKALMCILTTLGSSGSAAIKVISNGKILRALLSFVVPNDTASDWNPAQFEELQLLALSSLATLAPHCVDDYMVCQANTRVLLLIEWCGKQQVKFQGHGNSFHGDGGRGSRLSQLRYCLRLLLNMCSGNDEAITQDLHEQGAVPLLIALLKQLYGSNDDSNLPILLEIQSDILLITSCVCEMDPHRKELFGGYDGARLLIDYLKRDISKFGSGLGHHRLLLTATDCVWCTVVGNPLVEEIFLELEGVFVLLDILQVCPDNMQNLVLGVMVDLCENPKAIPHVGSWRGSGDKSVWSLLSELWRKEERDMGVPRGPMDTLAGTSQPLVGAEQSACGVPPLSSQTPSAAVNNVGENMRAKIYALCCKMGFQYPMDDLPTEDRVTMCIIESYLDFKSGEVWYEVAGELAQEGLRPVTPDQECITDILQTHEEKAEETLRLQDELIDDERRSEEAQEQQFYDKIRQSHLSQDKAKRDFTDFVERTSNYKSLQEAKYSQNKALDDSGRSNVAIGNRFHTVEQSGLNVTAFCGRHVSIATTPMKLLTDNIVPTSPRHTTNTSLNT